MIVLAEGIGRASGPLGIPLLGAFVMVVIFPNVGNFGIPLADFAFRPGRSQRRFVLVTAVQGVLLYTLGVYVAAQGDEGAVRENVKRVFSLPLVYAVLVALARIWLGVVPPTDSTLVCRRSNCSKRVYPGDARRAGYPGFSSVDVEGALRPWASRAGSKLVVAPVVALAAALLVGFGDATVARVVVLLLAGPTAVTPIILVGAFSADTDGITASEFVSATVFLTTVARRRHCHSAGRDSPVRRGSVEFTVDVGAGRRPRAYSSAATNSSGSTPSSTPPRTVPGTWSSCLLITTNRELT